MENETQKDNSDLILEIQNLQESLNSLVKYIDEINTFLPLPFCYINPLGIIINVNKSFVKFFEYEETEIIGNDFTILFKDSNEAVFLKKELKKINEIKGKEITVLTKNKVEKIVAITIKTKRDDEGNINGYFIAFTDITPLRKFQKSLEEKAKERTAELDKSRIALMNILEDVEKERNRAEQESNKTLAIIQNFTDGLLVFDKEGKVSLANPQTESFFKIKVQDLIGKSLSELEKIPTLNPLIQLFGREIKRISKKELQTDENLILEVSTIPLILREEKIGDLVILHDITREKNIERMKSEFVSISAHQLRTPLSAIKWSLKMLLDGDLGPINQGQKEFLEKAYASNERMIRLINDLLNVAKIEEGRFLFSPQLEDLKEIIKEQFPIFRELAQKKGLEIELIFKKDRYPWVKIDKEKISLVIQNLVENAINYTKQGKITITLDINNDNLFFSVKDTGIGIPESQKSRIFSRFFRGENAILSETEGTGLGLFIAKNIVEAHGGKIWFESKEGKGTTFYFTIPFSKELEDLIVKL